MTEMTFIYNFTSSQIYILLACLTSFKPGRVAQSVGHLTRMPEVLGSIPGLATYFRFSPSADSRGAVVSYWRKHVHEVLIKTATEV